MYAALLHIDHEVVLRHSHREDACFERGHPQARYCRRSTHSCSWLPSSSSWWGASPLSWARHSADTCWYADARPFHFVCIVAVALAFATIARFASDTHRLAALRHTGIARMSTPCAWMPALSIASKRMTSPRSTGLADPVHGASDAGHARLLERP
jgi:hypothetical protein